MGRPNVTIDWKLVARYAEAGATGVEIAAAIGVSYSALQKNFPKKEFGLKHLSLFLQEKRALGDLRLKLKIFDQAVNGVTQIKDKKYDPGTTTIRIFLAKSRLGMVEAKAEETQEASKTNIVFNTKLSNLSPDEE